MQITKTTIEEGFVEMVLSDGSEGGEQIDVRMRTPLDELERLAGHQLASLRAVRDAIGGEIQRLQSLVDHNT